MRSLLIIIVLLIVQYISIASVYYVASSGDDNLNGNSPASAFQSINRVNQVSLAPGDSVLFNRGDLFRGMLTIQSSGTAGHSIYIGAYGSGNLPIISGAEILTGFTNSSKNIYEALCPTCPSQLQQIFINNERHIPARYPNFGYFPMTNVNNTDSTFTAASLKNDAKGVWDSAALFLRTQHWVIDEFIVKSYLPQQITYSIPPHFYTSYAIQNNFGYFLSGKFIALDSAGEWYYNNVTNQLYIIPVNADSLINNGAEVSMYTNCIQLAVGVRYITIENIQLEKSLQDAVFLNQTSFIMISACTILQAGRDGVGGYQNYSTSNNWLTVQNCLIRDICNTGINLGSGTNVLLSGNTIQLNGMIPGLGAGYDAGYGGIYCPSNSKVTSNVLDSIGYVAIRISSNDTAVYNYCTNYGLTKNDCGGVYWWNGSNNYVAYNITGDGHANGQGTIYPDGMMVEGIYSDDYSHNNVIEYNTAYRNESGIIIHNTANSIVRNNVCYDNRRAQLYILEGSPHFTTTSVHGNQVKNNVFQCLHPSQKAMVLETEQNNIATMASCDSNWYCNPYEDEVIEMAYSPGYSSGNTTFRYTGLTLQQWQSNYSLDMNSHTAFDYPSSYARYTPLGSNLIMNSTFSLGTGWWYTYSNTDFSISGSPANTNPQITTTSLSGQYQNSQTLSPGNWGISSIQTTQNSQYLLTYGVAGQSTGGFQFATTFKNVPYTRNMVPGVIFKPFTSQLRYDTILFTGIYAVDNSLNFNSSSFDGNFWMDDVYLYEVDVDTSIAYPHTMSRLFVNSSNIPMTLSSAGNYRNLDGTVVTTNIQLKPYTSVVLKDLSAKITSIQKKALSHAEISVFPNPASDKLFIQEKAPSSNTSTVRITDVRGVELYNASYQSQGISIPAQWANGMYMLLYTNGDNQYAGRFVVNR